MPGQAVGIVAKIVDKKIPRHRRIFRSEGMKGRNLVVVGKFGILVCRVAGIAAGFQQQDLHASFRKTRGYRAAAGAGADHDVVVVVRRRGLHGQNVLMNSISACLSLSLSAGLGPYDFSSSLNPSVSLNFAVPK